MPLDDNIPPNFDNGYIFMLVELAGIIYLLNRLIYG